jgi:fibronectin-binding autotransporter adhesin
MKKSMIVFSMISTVSAVYAINWLAPKTDSKDNPTVPSMSSWDNPANWDGGVKPGPDDTAGFGWENNQPNGQYSIVLGASQTIKTLQQNSWRNLPSPTYFGVEDDRLFGHTITLRDLVIGNNTGGMGFVVPDVILSGDGTWSLNSGYNESNTIAIWGSISGPYGITKTDNGVAVLASRNTYTGTTTISGGKLQLGDGDTRTGGIAGDIVNNATLVVDPARGGVVTLGNLSGTGSVQKKGMGTLVFAGTDSLSSEGSFLITQHVWEDYGTGPIDCTVPNGQLSFSSYSFNYNFEFIGSENLDMGSGNVVLTPYDGNQNNAARTITVRRKKLVFGGPVSTSANMSLAKAGNGTLELKSASTYANSTAVNGGTLLLSDGGTAAGNITVGADGSLVLDNSTQTADRIGDAEY